MNTAVVVQMKQRQATLRDQCVDASSRLNRTPPMGAPKAACTRARFYDLAGDVGPHAARCNKGSAFSSTSYLAEDRESTLQGEGL